MTLRKSNDESRPGVSRKLQAVGIIAVLVIDYVTILRIEIFDEMSNGKSAIEAVMQGNFPLTFLGLLISITGFAWLLSLLLGKRK